MLTSTGNDTVKRFAKLHQKKYRDKEGLFIIEGPHLVEEALKHGRVHTVFSLEKREGAVQVNQAVMKKLTDTHHVPPVAAVAFKPELKTLSDKVLILERIQDPGNVGTLIRTALAFGFTSVVLDRTADVYSPKVIRSTQGAIFQMDLRFMDVKSFKEANPEHTLYAAAVDGTAAFKSPEGPCGLVLGNEGQGLESSTQRLCEHLIRIPIDHIDSLNVAVAGGILMHKLK